MSKMKSWNDEPAIQQKEYSQEKYNKKKRKSLRVAKLSCYSAELMVVIGWNMMLSLILFLVLCLVLVVLFSIAGFTYAISYKVTEVMCIHLDGGLDGAVEVNDAAMRANLKGQAAKAAGLAYVDAKALAGPVGILTRYCIQNNIKMLTSRFFKFLHRTLVIVQILLAFICIFVLLH